VNSEERLKVVAALDLDPAAIGPATTTDTVAVQFGGA
jgi:hypothetical protein